MVWVCLVVVSTNHTVGTRGPAHEVFTVHSCHHCTRLMDHVFIVQIKWKITFQSCDVLMYTIQHYSSQLAFGASNYLNNVSLIFWPCVCLYVGMFRNLTSAGKISPHKTRTMKDQEAVSGCGYGCGLPFHTNNIKSLTLLFPLLPHQQLGEYKKENFGLKLRIYHLEEVLRRKWGDSDDGWKMVNILCGLVY